MGKDELTKLIEHALRDDDNAWRRLVSDYTPFIFATARKVFRRYSFDASQEDLADIASDVWFNLVDKNRFLMEKCKQKDNFLQTLYVLTRNRVVDMLRKNSKEVAFDEKISCDEAVGFSDPLNMIYNEIRLMDFQEPIYSAIQQLSERERTLIILFYLQGKKYKEIARLTGIPQNSIGPTLQRAVQKLQSLIQANNE